MPQSLIDIVPREQSGGLRFWVAWHQYHMMHATVLLPQSLPMPPCQGPRRLQCASHNKPTWYTKLRRRVVPPNPSEVSLVAQVHYKPCRKGAKSRGAKRAQLSQPAKASRILNDSFGA